MSRKTNGPDFGDHLDRQCGPVDARQAAQPQDRGGHAGARVTGGHDGVGLAAPDEVGGDEDRGVLLLAQGEGRMLVHLDDLRGVDDRHVRSGQRRAGDLHDRGPVADEDHVVRRVLRGVAEGAVDDLLGGVVATHRVDRDADPAILRGRPGRRSGPPDQEAESLDFVFGSKTWRPP